MAPAVINNIPREQRFLLIKEKAERLYEAQDVDHISFKLISIADEHKVINMDPENPDTGVLPLCILEYSVQKIMRDGWGLTPAHRQPQKFINGPLPRKAAAMAPCLIDGESIEIIGKITLDRPQVFSQRVIYGEGDRCGLQMHHRLVSMFRGITQIEHTSRLST